MKRNFGKVLGIWPIYLALASAAVLIGANAVTNEARNGRILKNPVTIEGRVVSIRPEGRNLEVRLDSSEQPVDFLAYTLSFSFRDDKYRHDIAVIHDLHKKLKEGDQVKVEGFKDQHKGVIYGADIKKWEYVSLMKK
ncbi:MAG: hypothetical protein Q7J54_06745 [Candidatus Woesearchaeota archaeon]|nr:hypothetical protein [Candidatus Woesearchaeota archaeon]